MENEKKSGDKYAKLAGNTLIFAAVVLAQLPLEMLHRVKKAS